MHESNRLIFCAHIQDLELRRWMLFCVCVLVEQVEQMNSLLHQKQKELGVAVSKVEDLSKQLETLKHGQLDVLHSNQSSVAELDRLYRELQVRAEELKITARYWIFADIRYADIFQLILVNTDIFPFVWKQHQVSPVQKL